ncbi:hypothetical protein MUP01_00685 [Candidatus Bathyarchaeota archaeon]|nr:hypothetical protein [Candidatus Bathyarchaeota archaeon]
MKVLKGTLLLCGHFHRFRITIYAETKEATAQIAEVLQRKMQQKGWMPNAL